MNTSAFVRCIDEQTIELLNRTTSIINETAVQEFKESMVEAITQFLTPGFHLGFIAILAIAIILHEHPFVPMIPFFVAYIGAYSHLNNVNIISLVFHHWIRVFVCSITYVCVGAAWTIPKWWIFVRKSKNHENFKREYQRLLHKKDRNSEISANERYEAALAIVNQNKYRFYTWMMWWPLNFIYTFARDPLIVFYNWVYAKLTKTFTNILLEAFTDNY